MTNDNCKTQTKNAILNLTMDRFVGHFKKNLKEVKSESYAEAEHPYLQPMLSGSKYYIEAQGRLKPLLQKTVIFDYCEPNFYRKY